MKNAEIARLFGTMADIMEIQGQNAFRVNSYRRIARVVGDMVEDVEQLAGGGRLTDIQGIGKSSAEKIKEYLDTGRMSAYEKLVAGFPTEALDMLGIPGLGPKTVARLINERDITSIEALEKALETGQLDGLAGIRARSVEKMRKGIDLVKRSRGRTLLGEALPLAESIIKELRDKVALGAVEAAGSLRRRKETIGDIDILATVAAPKRGKGAQKEIAAAGAKVVGAFTSLEDVEDVLASGPTKGSVRTTGGLQVDLRVVEPGSFGAALQYFTGSKAHNVKVRGLAQDRGLKINEYGVFKGERQVAGTSEEEVYAALGMPWVPPELREDRGEVEAALVGELPELVELKQIKGDLHVHTNYSDGVLSVLETARAARQYGYGYVALTDHSKNLTIARGLDEETLRRRNAEIDEANSRLKGFTILKGTEVDILKDGSLDYDDEVLAELDFVIASVHDNFGMAEGAMTERILRAVRNRRVHAIGHLTGRLLGRRDAYEVNVPAVVEECARTGTWLELNAHPERLDITDVVCHEAKQAGVKVVINTDAHNSSHFPFMQYGVATARRGWLSEGDVVNCLTPAKLKGLLKTKSA